MMLRWLKIGFYGLFSLLGVAPLCGQTLPDSQSVNEDVTRLRSSSTMFGIGGRNLLDTYLSPEEYTGTEVRFMRENMRLTKWMSHRVSVQHIFQGNFAYCKSPTEDAKDLATLIDWTIAWHYHWTPAEGFRIMAGPQVGLHGGFVYNTRNGNNPAQGRLSTDISVSGMAIYSFQALRRHLTLRYQADIPMVGVMFSPNYGQSYYEIFSLGHYDHNVCVTSFARAFSFRQLLTLDIPMGRSTLRLGYMGDIRQTHVNNLKTHDWSHLFLIGYVRHFSLIREKDRRRSQFIF